MSQVAVLHLGSDPCVFECSIQKAAMKKREQCCMFLKEMYVPAVLKYRFFFPFF